jgi:hypothetical protein
VVPQGFTNTFHQFDFRPCGKLRPDVYGADRTFNPNGSRFEEILPDERVVIEHSREVHRFLLDIRRAENPGGPRNFRQRGGMRSL